MRSRYYRMRKGETKIPALGNRKRGEKDFIDKKVIKTRINTLKPLVCKHNFRRRIIVYNIAVTSTDCNTFDRQLTQSKIPMHPL